MNTPTEIFEKAERLMDDLGFDIIKSDRSRPWGGFLVINENQAKKFAKQLSS